MCFVCSAASDVEPAPRASKLSVGRSSSAENVSSASAEEEGSSLPRTIPGGSHAAEKKSWDNLLASQLHTGSEESGLSIFGLMDLYTMQNSLSG